jgi:hypothetical protein
VQTFVRDGVEGARVVGSPVNLGVAGGGNLGRGVARGDLLVILHDDAEPRPGWLAELVSVADRHPEAGVVGSRVVNPDGTLQGAGGVVFANGDVGKLTDDPPPSLLERPVDFCQSCALLVRSRLWDSLGGLDEEFFPAYFVDVDLGIAAWQAGWSVLCAQHAEAAHHGGASNTVDYIRFLLQRNQERLCQKWPVALSQHVSRRGGGTRAMELALERVRLLARQCHEAGAPTGVPASPPQGTLGIARDKSAELRVQRLENEIRDEFISYMARQQRTGVRCRSAVASVVASVRTRIRMRTRLRRLLGGLLRTARHGETQ